MDDSSNQQTTTTTSTIPPCRKSEEEIKAEARAFALGLATTTTKMEDDDSTPALPKETTIAPPTDNDASALISSSISRARELMGNVSTSTATVAANEMTVTHASEDTPTSTTETSKNGLKWNSNNGKVNHDATTKSSDSVEENAATTATTTTLEAVATGVADPHSKASPPAASEPLDEMYSHFVKSLGLHVFDEDDPVRQAMFLDDDDEDEFQWDAEEEEVEDDDDDDDDGEGANDSATQDDNSKAKLKTDESGEDIAPMDDKPIDKDDHDDGGSISLNELQEELGWLADEEMEALENLGGGGDAAMAIAMSLTPERAPTDMSTSDSAALNASPLRSHPLFLTPATPQQQEQLKSLLQQQFQLLFQLSVQSVRAAKIRPECVVSPGMTACHHIDIVDQAVGMLQDIKQHRQDAIRKTIAPQRQLFTRSQFRQVDTREVVTAFDISGVVKLNEAFAFFDKSVAGQEKKNILAIDSNAEACRYLFKSCAIEYSKDLLPAVYDLSTNFSDPKEILGPQFEEPCTTSQIGVLEKNLNMFTASEDNLILRGVAAHGEKKWGQVSLHFLPERPSPLINQRYSKLTMFIFKAKGVTIYDDGSLPPIQKFHSLDDVDHDALNQLRKLPTPASVHPNHWSVEEDVTLLKGVQVLGSMWAEIRALLIPHRDRGHLRKRYQMLERRIKNCVIRSNKHDMALMRRIGTPTKSDDNAKGRGSLSMTAIAMARRTKKSAAQNDDTKAPAPSRKKKAEAAPAMTPPRAHPAAPMYPPGGYYGYPPPPHTQSSPQHPYPQHPPQYPQPPSPQQSSQTPPHQPPMYHHPYHQPHPAQGGAPPPHSYHQPQPGAHPYPYPPHPYPPPYYYGGQPPPYGGAQYPGPPPPYYPPALPTASGAGQSPAPLSHQEPLSPPVPHRTSNEAEANGDTTSAAAPDESRMAVEHLLLMSASKSGTQPSGGSARASKRGRRKGDSRSLFSGVMNRLGTGEDDTHETITSKGANGAVKSPEGKVETLEEERLNNNLTPPVYLPDEKLTTSSIGTFHNMASSPFLGNLDGTQSRPMTRTSLFGGPKAAEEDMEAVSALKSLGTPSKNRGTKRKSLFESVIGQSSEA